jgi:hypothetical protein
MSDSYLDALIEAALKTDAIVTPRQKRRAWERLEQRASQQTIWPPLVEPRTSFAGTLRMACVRVLRGLAIFLVDEGSYQRAYDERRAFGLVSVRTASFSRSTLESSPHVRSQL